MHDRTDLILARIRRLLYERITPAIYRDRRPLTVTAWSAPGEPVAFDEALGHDFTSLAPGAPWGGAHLLGSEVGAHRERDISAGAFANLS